MSASPSPHHSSSAVVRTDSPDSRRTNHVLIIAGEASGDLHAAKLIAELRKLRPDLRFTGIGGDAVRAQGADLLFDAAQMNVSGFLEVLKHYPFLRSAFRSTVERARNASPSLAILVDYPGFNLRLARELHALNIPVVYYIAPQVWAWKEGRVEAIRRYVADLIVAFPFEVEYFARHGITARFFGHPLVDEIVESTDAGETPRGDGRPIIAYLPGSRAQEIHRHMPIISAVIVLLGPSYRHVIPLAKTLKREIFEPYSALARFELLPSARQALAIADAALVKAGTSTVEAALFGVPFAAFYRTSWLSYQIARRAIRLPWIAMVNILAGRGIVREFIQDQIEPQAVADELRLLVADDAYRRRVIDDVNEVRESLGGPGASRRAAEFIFENYLR
jgi:lipid-A-disaccharide synthase